MSPEVSAARTACIEAIRQHRRKEITTDALYAAADAYIATIAAVYKARKIRRKPPARAYLIRALG